MFWIGGSGLAGASSLRTIKSASPALVVSSQPKLTLWSWTSASVPMPAESLQGVGEHHLLDKSLLLDGRVPFTFLKPEASASDTDKSNLNDGFVLLASTVPGDVPEEHYGLLKGLGFAMESAAEMTRLPPGMASDSQLVKAAQKIFRSSHASVDDRMLSLLSLHVFLLASRPLEVTRCSLQDLPKELAGASTASVKAVGPSRTNRRQKTTGRHRKAPKRLAKQRNTKRRRPRSESQGRPDDVLSSFVDWVRGSLAQFRHPKHCWTAVLAVSARRDLSQNLLATWPRRHNAS